MKGGRKKERRMDGSEIKFERQIKKQPTVLDPFSTDLFTTSLYPGACLSDTGFRKGLLNLLKNKL